MYEFDLSSVSLDLKEEDAIKSKDKMFLTAAVCSQGQDSAMLNRGGWVLRSDCLGSNPPFTTSYATQAFNLSED